MVPLERVGTPAAVVFVLVITDNTDEVELLDWENPLEAAVTELFSEAVGVPLIELDLMLPYSAPLEKVGIPV